ncbi:MAG: GspH/FimT family pseudopilin [Cellvibrionaceae bacterium]
MNGKVSSNRGFTLIELVVALAILGILLVAGIPGLTTLLNNNDVRTTSTKLVDSIAHARALAADNVVPVRICPKICNDASTWKDGWQIFVDLDGDGAFESDELALVESNVGGKTTITSAETVIDFDLKGNNANSGLSLTVKKDGATDRVVTVSNTGYVTVK